MRLADYMEARGLSDETLAKRLKVSRPTVSRIRRGKIRPGWNTIKILERVTDGLVTANDFLNSNGARSA